MKTKLSAITLLSILVAGNSFAMGIIIGENVANGDFETSAGSPWEGCTVVSNSDYALQGYGYAQTVPGTSQAEIYQYSPPSTPRPDLVYYFSFFVRNRDPGYPVVYGSLSARREDDSFIQATVLESNQVPVADTEWTRYSYICSFGSIPNESLRLKTAIHFEGGETNSEAFVDLLYLFDDVSSTRLSELAVQNGTLTLSISNLAPTNRCWVQRNFTLADDGWVSVSEIDLMQSVVQWSEDISNQWHKAFYRLWKE